MQEIRTNKYYGYLGTGVDLLGLWLSKINLVQAMLWGLILGWSTQVHVGLTLVTVFCICQVMIQHLEHKRLWLYGGVLYATTMAYHISWWWGMYPIDWIPMTHTESIAMILFFWLFTSICVGLAITVGLQVLRLIRWDGNPLVFAAWWVVVECLGSFMFYCATYGTDSLWGAHYSFAYVGYATTHTWFMPLFAPVGGVILLSFVVVYVAAILVHQTRGGRIWAHLVIILALFVMAGGYYLFNNHQIQNKHAETIEVAAISTWASRHSMLDQAGRYVLHNDISNELLEIASHSTLPDLIALPEGSGYVHHQGTQGYNFDLPALVDTTRVPSLQGGVDDQYGTVTTYHPTEGYAYQYQKQLLAPNGEYLSLLLGWVMHLFGKERMQDYYEQVSVYSKGSESTVTRLRGMNLGVTMCSEIYSPWIQAEMAGESTILVNLASHSSLRNHPVLHKQAMQMSQMRAAENHRYLLRSSNYGQSMIINHRGRVVELSEGQVAHVRSTAQLYDLRTLFNRFPYATIILCMLIVLSIRLSRNRI